MFRAVRPSVSSTRSGQSQLKEITYFPLQSELKDFVAGAVFGEVGGGLCSSHGKRRFTCDWIDHSCDSFSIAGAVFGEVAG